jgi:hypothetical protein
MTEAPIQRRLRLRTVSPESRGQDRGPDWKDLIAQSKLVPFIGNSISNRHLFTDTFGERILRWARAVGCPWPEWQNVAAVAQYVLMADSSETKARQKYLAHLKDELASDVEQDGTISEKQIAKISEKFANPDYSLTDLAYDLGYLDFENASDHPLRLLANLPFKVYVTTSYHRFLEAALFQAGKQPVSEIYPWNPALEKSTTTIFQQVPNYAPSDNRPLVYHLFGRDDLPDSLVLSENDYLDLLIKISFDKGGSRTGANTSAKGELIAQGLPEVIIDRLVYDSSPLLLGYELEDWDFRVLFRGLIKATREVRLGTGFFIQQFSTGNLQDEQSIKTQLDQYIRDKSGLKILWCQVEDCVKMLYDAWVRP